METIKIPNLYVCMTYSTVEGQYLGTPYRFLDVILRQHTGDNNGQKFAARLKGAHLDRFLAEGMDTNRTPHTFSLIFDCKESFHKDGTRYPQNTLPVITDWEE